MRVAARAQQRQLHDRARARRAAGAGRWARESGRVCRPSIVLMMSPGRSPAFSAGEPGAGGHDHQEREPPGEHEADLGVAVLAAGCW